MALFCFRCQQFLDGHETVCPTCFIALDNAPNTDALQPSRYMPDKLPEVAHNASRLDKASPDQLLEEIHQLHLELTWRREMIDRLEASNAELRQTNDLLEEMSAKDALTGVLNRRATEDLASQQLQLRQRGPLAFGLVAVDHLEEINARYLVPAGDKVLVDLAKTLKYSLSTVDLLGRISGTAFMVLAPAMSTEEALAKAEQIREIAKRTFFFYKGDTIPVRVSVGFVVAEQGADYEQIKHMAAAALEQDRPPQWRHELSDGAKEWVQVVATVNSWANTQTSQPSRGQLQLSLRRSSQNLELNDGANWNSVLDDAAKILDAERGAILLAEGPEGTLLLRALHRGQGENLQLAFFSQSLAQWCLANGKSALCWWYTSESGTSIYQANSVLSVLLRTRNRATGLLFLVRAPLQMPFSEEDLHLADAIADLAP